MEKEEILAVVKELHSGDSVHVEYKEPLSKLKVLDTKYMGMSCDSFPNMKVSPLVCEGDDFLSFAIDAAKTLFNYIDLCYLHPDGQSKASVKMKHIIEVRKQ